MTEPLTRGSSLRIDSDQDLIDTASANGWSGNGAIMDPFIIEDLNMSGNTGGACLYLGNTTLHVIIRNCTFARSGFVAETYGEGTGITVFSASNVTIMGCNASYCVIGFQMIESDNVNIRDSDLTWNYMYGIHLLGADRTRVEGCNVEWNDFGIYVATSSNVTVEGCYCHDNDDHGVRFDTSHHCNVWNSTFVMNDDGVNLEMGSQYNNISSNMMKDCRESAIAIGDSENNIFYGNIMTNCSFYFPMEPLTVRYNIISRSNKVGGKDVLFIYWDMDYEIEHEDLSSVGQLIMVSSRGYSLSEFDVEGGSQAVVLLDCDGIQLCNMTISDQTFHALIAYQCEQVTLDNCTIFD
ncbi:MAG: right-handed parallel beta-helix repeat-containing protein, partial [Candidatus Thermoplasmatota archaeon]|nr:right-handed parallel beta-helix repeat-containing protein [Candidatus Thermoplasmatota archaeon]